MIFESTDVIYFDLNCIFFYNFKIVIILSLFLGSHARGIAAIGTNHLAVGRDDDYDDDNVDDDDDVDNDDDDDVDDDNFDDDDVDNDDDDDVDDTHYHARNNDNDEDFYANFDEFDDDKGDHDNDVGLHTGEVLLFCVELKGESYICFITGRYRIQEVYGASLQLAVLSFKSPIADSMSRVVSK